MVIDEEQGLGAGVPPADEGRRVLIIWVLENVVKEEVSLLLDWHVEVTSFRELWSMVWMFYSELVVVNSNHL